MKISVRIYYSKKLVLTLVQNLSLGKYFIIPSQSAHALPSAAVAGFHYLGEASCCPVHYGKRAVAGGHKL